jgi:hypothetical protein
MKWNTLFQLAALSSVTLTNTLASSLQVQPHFKKASWISVGHGAYMRQGAVNGKKYLEYRGFGLDAQRVIAARLLQKNPKAARFFLANLASNRSKPHLQLVDIPNDCSGWGEGSGASALVVVSCSTNVTINSYIQLDPPAGSAASANQSYTDVGSAIHQLSTSGDCGDLCGAVDPNAWDSIEWWQASDGESGFYCQSGPDNGGAC